MSWTKLIYKTLRYEKKFILAYLINTVILILIFNLSMDSVSIIYPLVMSATIFFIFMIFKVVDIFKLTEKLGASKMKLSIDDSSDDGLEQMVLQSIDEIHDNYLEKIHMLQGQLNSRNALFSQFLHNMKSSATIIELACSKESSEVMTDIEFENEKQKKNLEQALNILRLDEFANDYVPEKVELSKLVNEVINNRKKEFIYAQVYPKFKEASAIVYTDKKWSMYIIEQILSNAVKYSKTGANVFFDIEIKDGQTELHIRDEGIGIEAEDLPRVFDLFFTGSNGRLHKEATGIGLAMVKYIAKQLGHFVRIESIAGKGTTVVISFLTKM